MAKVDLQKLKQLPPEERVKVLKQLQERFAAKKRASENEIAEALMMLEESKNELRVLREVEVPRPKPIEISELFKPKEETLETIAAEQMREEPPLSQPQETYAAEPQRPVYTGAGEQDLYHKGEQEERTRQQRDPMRRRNEELTSAERALREMYQDNEQEYQQ